MKKDLIKSAAAALVIVVLAIIVVNMNQFISPKTAKMVDQKQNVLSEGSSADYGKCFDKDPSTIVFIYSNSCPHCKSMKPIIQELEEEGYEFYWAEGSDNEARDVVTGCFGDLIGGYVPQFICPATGKEQTGAMSKTRLKDFADTCRQQ